jgi:hypothetical protein
MEDHPMITVSNQVCLAKMATRGFQEVLNRGFDIFYRVNS